MPKFDATVWKKTRPKSAEGSGIAEAIKLWNTNCPEQFDSFSDVKKLAVAQATAAKFLTAITTAKGKIAKDKDVKSAEAVKKTKALLDTWETQVEHYKTGASDWATNYIKQKGGAIQAKNLKAAQDDLEAILVTQGLESLIQRMQDNEKDFLKVLATGDLNRAGALLDNYRKFAKQAEGLASPAELARYCKLNAEKFTVPLKDLTAPPGYDAAKKTFAALDNKLDVLQDQFEQATEAAASMQVEPTGKADPAYKKAIAEGLAGYKDINNKIKAIVPVGAKYLSDATAVASVKPGAVLVDKFVPAAGKLNKAIFDSQTEIINHLNLTRNQGSPVRKKLVEAGLTKEDDAKIFNPQMNVAYAQNKKFLDVTGKARALLKGWLQSVIEAKPDLQSAKTELANMDSIYKVKTQVAT